MSWFTKPGSTFDMGPRFPVLDGNRQSSIPRLYMAGDVTGTPDIKAAINAGAEVARHILKGGIECRPPCDAHVIIVGGGPAGVSAALEFEKAARHRSNGDAGYWLLEKRRLFHALHGFAKCKPLFYPSTGPRERTGELWFEEPEDGAGIRTCELLEIWEEQVRKNPIRVRLGENVTDIQKTDKFRVVTDQRNYFCDRVILCVGKLVYLTKLDVGLEAAPKVFYEPPEPDRYRDRDIVVAGENNEALETALELSSRNRVTLVQASTALSDADRTLIDAVENGVRDGKLNRLANARVKKIDLETVEIEAPSARALKLKNDAVFAFLGIEKTELPITFFRKIRVAYERDWNLKRYLLFLSSILAVAAFYILKKFAPGVVMVHTPALPGVPEMTWDLGSLYPLVYTLIVAGFGVRAIWRWKKHRWRVRREFGGQQTLRLASLIFFQAFFFFVVPLFIVKDWRAWGLLYPWPLVFHPGTVGAFKASRFWWWWSLGLILAGVPVLTYFHGKKFCTWVCGCGGLAESLGDVWRHYSPKGTRNTRKERQIYLVTAFAALATVLVAAGHDFTVAGITLSKVYSYTVDLVLIAIIPIAMYPFMGGKVWCRYWCPVVGVMNLVGNKLSRFRISPDKHRCIACNLCSRYCEVGVDVMKHALKGEAFGMWNSSCIGCGICIHVCPTDVLRFGHHQLVTLSTAPPLRQRPGA